MNDVEQAMGKAQEEISAYIETLSASEAVFIAGSTAHAVAELGRNPLVNPLQLRVSTGIYLELIRQLCAHSARQSPRPAHSLLQGWNELVLRIVTEVNQAILGGGQ